MKKRILALIVAFLIIFTVSCETQPPEATVCTEHSDADSNGYCDLCGISVTVIIDFYALNDLHGKLLDGDGQPGVDNLTSYLKTIREYNPNTVILSSGDMWQGSSESNLTYGLMMTDWMNCLGFASMTLGNHEFDWGEERIRENLELAEFPFLAINIYDRDTDKPVDYCQPSVTVNCGEATVGIIGAIGDCYSSISGDKSGGFYFKTGAQLTSLIKAESERLRAEGADFIVLSVHDGMDAYDISLSDGSVDLVFEGHTHRYYVREDVGGVNHLQGGGDNDGISHATAVVNFAGGESRFTEAEYLSSTVYKTSPSDPVINELLTKYEDTIAKAGEVLGTNAVMRNGDWLRSLVARLYFEEGFKAWGAQYGIVLGGGFLSVRSPYNLAAGEVRYSDLQSIFPFDNRIDLCAVKGSDLRRNFLETTNSNYFIYCGDYGNSVRYSIDDNATYYIIVDSYTSSYAPNRLTVVASLDGDLFARDLLAEYIRNGGLS
ncbi:MAG: bifunctional metallophosphatase/5'-nucleotidase [Eubacteriales bacterium]